MKICFTLLSLMLAPATLALEAHYAAPVERYGHNILGDTPEWSELCIGDYCAQANADAIFEDVSPLVADLDFDGTPEVIAVISTMSEGASLAIYDDQAQMITQTPPIGTPKRWLAPIGVADFDHNGIMDIAYVETPHIGGLLKIWEYRQGQLQPILETRYFTNHKIGDNFMTSDIRSCGDRDEILLLNQERDAIMAVGFFTESGTPYAARLADFTDQNWANRRALPCPARGN